MLTRFCLIATLACLAVGAEHASAAILIDNSTVTIQDAYTAYGGYDASNSIDVSLTQYLTDYASQGGGVNTFLEFDFGSQQTFSQIVFTDRTSSGGANSSNSLGILDFVTQYTYTFSNDGVTWSSPVSSGPLTAPVGPTSYLNFQSTVNIPNVTARYVRWDVDTTPGSNPGGANFSFYAATTPEPSSLALCGIGLLGMVGARVRRRRSK